MSTYTYDRSRFNPKKTHRPTSTKTQGVADERVAPPYVYTEDIVLAVNVALATGRPILVQGRSGTGKSTLARNAAEVLGRRYYEFVVTSRTQARDLLYEVDLVRRLHAATAAAVRAAPGGGQATFSDDFAPYIVPRALFWAFARERARWRGAAPDSHGAPLQDPAGEARKDKPAVVLIDEIDKADPDVPNNLLVPLGSLLFRIEEIETDIQATKDQAPLVFITTNDERRLPDAFLRRCVDLQLPGTTRERLVEIGRAHFPKRSIKDLEQLLTAIVGAPPEQPEQAAQRAVETLDLSPAEFVDTLRAAEGLAITPATPEWQALTGVTAFKHSRERKAST